MRNYSYFAMSRAKTVNYGLESFSYMNSKLWDSIPSHTKEINLLVNLNTLLKLGNLICAHADFVKFIYKLLDICSQQKKKRNFFPFTLRCTFTFPCLGISYGIYLYFDLQPWALISVLFINIAIVI